MAGGECRIRSRDRHLPGGSSASSAGGTVVCAAAAAAAAAAVAAAGVSAHPIDTDGNPTPATPSLSSRSSYAGSYDSSSSTAGNAVARRGAPNVRESYDRHSGLPADAVGATRSWGSATTAGLSGSSRSSSRTSLEPSSSSGSSSMESGAPINRPSVGDVDSKPSFGSHAAAEADAAMKGKRFALTPAVAADGGGGGGAGATGGVAGPPSSVGPKKVQLSISFLPAALAPLPDQYGAPAASVSGAALFTNGGGTPLAHEPYMLAMDGRLSAEALTVVAATPVAGAAAAGHEPLLLRSSAAPTSDGIATSVVGAGGGGGAAAAAASTAVAVPVAGRHNPGDGVVVVPEPESDLEDVDVIASVLVTSPDDVAATHRAAAHLAASGDGGGAAAAATAVAAAVAPSSDSDDGGADPGALPREVRRKLTGHLGRQKAKTIRSWKDLSHCMAGQPPGYWLLGTMALLLVMFGAFLFMAGQYEFVRPIDISTSGVMVAQQSDGEDLASSLTGDPLTNYSWGPSCLASWLAFWKSPPSRTFNFDYLRLWGGRYGPDLEAGQWWRWVTSLLLHQSSMHLASNTALLLVLSAYLESLFGFWRVVPVWVVAGVAGNMVSAFFESPCMLVVGSSLLGAYMADAALNFESIPLLWLRLVGMAVVAALLVALQATGHSGGGARGSSTSHASHIGGFLAGALLAVLLVPDFKANRSKKVSALLRSLGMGGHLPPPDSPAGEQLYSFWQRHQALRYVLYAVVAVVLLLMLVVLPATLYTHTFKRMVCG